MLQRACVAIPVRDEAEKIEQCLRALSVQAGGTPYHVVLLVNNTVDNTIAVVDRLRPSLDFPVTCVRRDYPPQHAHAGRARADAMTVAASIAGPHGVLLTTDADGQVAPDWLSANLAELAKGVDAVCGRAEIDPIEARAIPLHLHEDDAREIAYGTVLDRIHDLVDPDTFDPWPRHTEHSGASIAVTVAAWEGVGGVPPVAAGEDRAFLQALRRANYRIRHAPDVKVTVSGRIIGRAVGGMADTMARRLVCQDILLDGTLESPDDALRRARARCALRQLFENHVSTEGFQAFVRSLGIDDGLCAASLRNRSFGDAWEVVEASSPILLRRPVLREHLDEHHADAERIIHHLLRANKIENLGAGSDVNSHGDAVTEHANAQYT